jgi:hypothetical protein
MTDVDGSNLVLEILLAIVCIYVVRKAYVDKRRMWPVLLILLVIAPIPAVVGLLGQNYRGLFTTDVILSILILVRLLPYLGNLILNNLVLPLVSFVLAIFQPSTATRSASNHPLLDRFLPGMPTNTQRDLKRAFDPLRDANIEFATWISPDAAHCKRVSDEANAKHIAVWCNNDRASAFFYGLGKVDGDSFEDVMNWLRGITLSGKKATVRIVRQGAADMIVEIAM